MRWCSASARAIDSNHTLRKSQAANASGVGPAGADGGGVSAVLAIIQYNWTGRLSRSEAERLRVNLRSSFDKSTASGPPN